MKRPYFFSKDAGFTPTPFLRKTPDLKVWGFTLAELLVAIFIFSIIFAAITALLTTGNRLWQADSVLAELQGKARLGMDLVTKELYGANIISPDIGLSASSISFQVPASVTAGEIAWSSTVQYSVNNGRLLRSQAGTDDKVITDNLSSILFNHAESDLLKITLTLQKNTIFQKTLNVTLNAQVTLRN